MKFFCHKSNNERQHKDIVIFHVTAPQSEYDAYTNKLAIDMEKLAKKGNLDVSVRMDSASNIDKRGNDVDVILLTPELFAMEEEVKEKFPDKVVKVISKEAYGFLLAEYILKLALEK